MMPTITPGLPSLDCQDRLSPLNHFPCGCKLRFAAATKFSILSYAPNPAVCTRETLTQRRLKSVSTKGISKCFGQVRIFETLPTDHSYKRTGGVLHKSKRACSTGDGHLTSERSCRNKCRCQQWIGHQMKMIGFGPTSAE